MSNPEAARRLFRNAVREARTIVVVWALAFAWVVVVCYLLGYRHSEDDLVVRLGLASVRRPADIRLIAGFPDWIFYGIMVPWLLCSLFTVWYGQFGMSDDDLGTEAADAEGQAHGH